MNDILNKLHEAAASPRAQMDGYLAQGKKIVLCAPVYTPEEIIHAMGFVPMGAWGGDVALNRAKEYCPAFLCAIVQSLLELGINGAYEGASAIVIPSLCDTLKTVGENWKYAVPSIPFIPMTYPQNRKPAYGVAYTKAGYERVIRDLEKLGGTFSEEKLLASIKVYNRHNAAMRKIDELLAVHPEITAAQRSDIFKSAFFMTKEEHTELVEALIEKLEAQTPAAEKLPIVISGILTDAPALNAILDEMGLHIVADDVAAQSRQYRTDAPERADALNALAEKFANMDNCSVLYNQDKPRVKWIVDTARARNAKGVLVVLTKFCDPEEFDYVMIKTACESADLPLTLVEVDSQMVRFEQVRTNLETFRDLEKLGGIFSEEKLLSSIKVYNRHNDAMRKVDEVLAKHPEITAAQRSDIFKSAFFMTKEEHTELVEALVEKLEAQTPAAEKLPIVISGILTDAPALNAILDEMSLHIVADDVAAQSRQYRTDAPERDDALNALAEKFANMDNCSVLYNQDKPRVKWIVDTARARNAKGVLVVLTKFCDPEEFDYVMIKKACEAADLPLTLVEVDRQMVRFEQVRTNLETFRDLLKM